MMTRDEFAEGGHLLRRPDWVTGPEVEASETTMSETCSRHGFVSVRFAVTSSHHVVTPS